MSNYLSLDDAAKFLGISTEEMNETRLRGEIRGLRDGSSWKFRTEDLQRILEDRDGISLDESGSGSSLLLTELSGFGAGSVLGGDEANGGNNASKSDLLSGDEDDAQSFGSDVALVADPSSTSGLRLVNTGMPTPPLASADDDEEILGLEDSVEMELDASSLSLGPGNGMGLGSELQLTGEGTGSDLGMKTPSGSDGSDVLGGLGITSGSSMSDKKSSLSNADSDNDIMLGGEADGSSSSNEDDLVLGSVSDLSLSGDSGINLMSPADSGLSLEDDAFNLGGGGISGLDLGGEGSGSDVGASGSGGGISGIDFGAAEDFQLSPSGGIDVEEDSGSQVIEIEDSADLGGAMVADDAFGGGMQEDGGFADEGIGMGAGVLAGSAASPDLYRGSLEVPLKFWEVSVLLCIVMVLGLSGLLITDIVRNMWSWNGETQTSISGWFTAISDALGMQG